MNQGQIKESNKQSNWKYQVIWYRKRDREVRVATLEIDEVERQGITQEILSLCKKQQYSDWKLQFDIDYVKLEINTLAQINIGKFVRNLQKIVAKKEAMNLLEWEQVVFTISEEEASEDLRIQKLLQSIESATYYDLEEGLDQNELAKLKEILSHRKLGMIEKEEQVYLIDRKALLKEINLNCFECTKRHQYGCCCGTPCGLSDKNMTLFDQHILGMEEAVRNINGEQYKRLEANGGFMTANGKLRAFDGHCSLLVEEEGIYKCIAHKYALDTGIPIYDLCPLSCLMYPLEVIELLTNKRRKVYLFTSVVEETIASQFGRWGSYETLEVELRCIQKEAHNEIFKEDAYQPVYKVNEGLIKYEFGNLIYNSIKEILE